MFVVIMLGNVKSYETFNKELYLFKRGSNGKTS